MKAIVLISGGLDSALAAKLVKQQGIEIVALNFKSIFCRCDRKGPSGCAIDYAQKTAQELGVELKVINISEEMFKIINNPEYGYGANMNPCIDCRILKFRKAKEFMQAAGASFLVTGEVLAQRPMSQHKRALKTIEKESGLEGLVLRPLSAKLLPPTIPQRQGWVATDRLLGFSGRTRRPQMELARQLDVKNYSCPAGGCLLTEREFAKRLKDLMAKEELNINNVELLKLGRHFRLSPDAKLIVGRNESENQRLLNLAKDNDYLFDAVNLPGPVGLGRGNFTDELIELSSRIVCRYADLNGKGTAKIMCRKVPYEEKILVVAALEDSRAVKMRI